MYAHRTHRARIAWHTIPATATGVRVEKINRLRTYFLSRYLVDDHAEQGKPISGYRLQEICSKLDHFLQVKHEGDCNAKKPEGFQRSRLFHNLIRTTQRPPGYVAHNISRDPGLVDCTVDLCGHIGLHSPSPSPQCG
eukprot:g47775.t1